MQCSVKEDIFWRNYFYRVSLIKQSASMSTFAKQHSLSSNPSVSAPQSAGRSSPAEAAAQERAPAATSALDLGLGSQSIEADPEADAEISALGSGASSAPVSLPPEELAQLGLVPKASASAESKSNEAAKEKEEKAKASKHKNGSSPSGSDAGPGGSGNGTESGSDWEKDLQRELEASTSPESADALGDELLEKVRAFHCLLGI